MVGDLNRKTLYGKFRSGCCSDDCKSGTPRTVLSFNMENHSGARSSQRQCLARSQKRPANAPEISHNVLPYAFTLVHGWQAASRWRNSSNERWSRAREARFGAIWDGFDRTRKSRQIRSSHRSRPSDIADDTDSVQKDKKQCRFDRKSWDRQNRRDGRFSLAHRSW